MHRDNVPAREAFAEYNEAPIEFVPREADLSAVPATIRCEAVARKLTLTGRTVKDGQFTFAEAEGGIEIGYAAGRGFKVQPIPTT